MGSIGSVRARCNEAAIRSSSPLERSSSGAHLSQVIVPEDEGTGEARETPVRVDPAPAPSPPASNPQAPNSRAAPRRFSTVLPGSTVVPGLLALVVLSLALRLGGLGISLWLDEGLSVGIASHPLTAIPGLLVQDGSPPLYYLLLHGWMEMFGDSEEAVRGLSLLFGLAVVPTAFWAGRSLFTLRVGWVAAVLAATNPYLSYYSREGRMYTMLALLGLLCVTTFVHTFVYGRRRYLPWFAITLAAAMYTHNWGLYLALGLGTGAVACLLTSGDRRRVARDVLLGFGGAGLMYLPWLPTLVSQARSTGAPWSRTPGASALIEALQSVLGDSRVEVILLLFAFPALFALARRWRTPPGLVVVVLTTTLVATALIAWLSSQIEPAWASRYFGVFLVPVLLLAALGLAREGRRGLLALAVVVLVWADPVSRLPGFGPSPRVTQKSNVRALATLVAPTVEPGDLVVSTHMEHVPLLHYYLGPELSYADPSGLVADPRIADWRNASERMSEATPSLGLAPLVGDLPVGRHLLLACPRLDLDDNDPEWFELMDENCTNWRAALDADSSLKLVDGPLSPKPRRTPGSSLYVLVYQKLSPT